MPQCLICSGFDVVLDGRFVVCCFGVFFGLLVFLGDPVYMVQVLVWRGLDGCLSICETALVVCALLELVPCACVVLACWVCVAYVRRFAWRFLVCPCSRSALKCLPFGFWCVFDVVFRCVFYCFVFSSSGTVRSCCTGATFKIIFGDIYLYIPERIRFVILLLTVFY